MATINYRVGIDQNTGQPLVGYPHLVQSLAKIFSTVPQELVMLLDFGADLLAEIGKNLYAGEVLRIYSIIVSQINAWEPEFRVSRMQLVQLTQAGGLGLALSGIYFPEGRLGNYAISEPVAVNVSLTGATAS